MLRFPISLYCYGWLTFSSIEVRMAFCSTFGMMLLLTMSLSISESSIEMSRTLSMHAIMELNASRILNIHRATLGTNEEYLTNEFALGQHCLKTEK